MSPATLRTLFLVAVGLLVLWLGYQARAVVTPLLAALLLAYVLDPLVRPLERLGCSRAFASAVVVITALAALVTLTTLAATRLVREAEDFYHDVVGEPSGATRAELVKRLSADAPWNEPAAAARLDARLKTAQWQGRTVFYEDVDGNDAYDPGLAKLGAAKVREALAGTRWEGALDKALDELGKLGPDVAQTASSLLWGIVEGGRAVFSTAVGVVSLVFLFPIYLYYSLANLSRLYDVGVRHLPEGQRDRIVVILARIHVTLSAFFRGRLIAMFAKGLLLLGLFMAFGVPFGLVCAGFGALASLVPVFGGVVAAVPPLMLSLHDATGASLLALAVGIVVIEIIDAYLLIPRMVGRHVGLHPLTVLVCTLVAGDLLGFFGMLVAIPLTAVLKILAAEFVLPEVRRRAGIEKRDEAAPGAVPAAPPDAGPK